eukprot:scaffold47055_cov18-Tisochrysis_lutea.AAC.1
MQNSTQAHAGCIKKKKGLTEVVLDGHHSELVCSHVAESLLVAPSTVDGGHSGDVQVQRQPPQLLA